MRVIELLRLMALYSALYMSDIGNINHKHMVSYEIFMSHYHKSSLRAVFVQITSKKPRLKTVALSQENENSERSHWLKRRGPSF